MAKKVYVGDGVARRSKKIYVGVETAVPIFDVHTDTANITASNISTLFTVENGSYYFVGSGSTFTTNNAGKKSSVATTGLIAKVDMDIEFMYSYSTEQKYDKFTLTVAGKVVEDGVSGATTTKFYEGSLKAGQSIIFEYTKDTSTDSNDDKCTFSNMVVTTEVKNQTGTEVKELARKVKKAYVGDANGIARLFYSSAEFAQGTFNPLDGLATINVGFKPKQVLIWNTLSQSDSKNKLYGVYDESEFVVQGDPIGTATSLTTSKVSNLALVYVNRDWTDFKVSNTGFTFPKLTSYLESGVGTANYIALGEGSTVVRGNFTPTYNGANTVNVGFKPDYVVLIGDASYGEKTTDTRWEFLNTSLEAMYIDGTYAGLFSYEPDFDDSNTIVTAASMSGLTVSDTGFTFSSSHRYIGDNYEQSINTIAYLAIKKG